MYKICVRYMHYICFQAQVKMPESLGKKKKRLYNHLNNAMRTREYPMLRSVLYLNFNGRMLCRSPNEELRDIHFKLESLERRINELYDRRVALLEMKVELLVDALAKVIRLYC